MLSLNANRLERYTHNWIAFGIFVYLGAFFLLDKNNITYPFRTLVVLPTVLLCITTRFKCIQDRRAVFVSLAFLGYFSLSALWGEGKLWEAVKYTLFILCLMVSIATVSQRFLESFVIKFIIGIGLIAAIVYIAGIFLLDCSLMDLLNSRFSFHHITGWGNAHEIESSVIIGVPIVAAWYFFPRKKWYIKLMLIVTILLCAVLMFITKSRGPILSVAITLLCITLLRRAKSDFFLLFFFTILIGMIFLSFHDLSDIIVNRVESKNYRLTIWRKGLDLFMDHWMFGQGYKTRAEIVLEEAELPLRGAHSMYIEVLRTGGIVGGLLFIFMLSTMVRFSNIHPGNRFYLCWLFFGLLCVITNGKLPLAKPTEVEFFKFWFPLFLFYFAKKVSHVSATNELIEHQKTDFHQRSIRAAIDDVVPS